MTQPTGTIRNARVLSPDRVTIVGPATDARIIETQPAQASAPYLMRNPDEEARNPSSMKPPVMTAGPAQDAVVVEAQPLETTAPESTESESPVARRRHRP